MALSNTYGTTPTAAMLDQAALFTDLGYFSFFSHLPKLDKTGNFSPRFANDIKSLKAYLDRGDYFVIEVQ